MNMFIATNLLPQTRRCVSKKLPNRTAQLEQTVETLLTQSHPCVKQLPASLMMSASSSPSNIYATQGLSSSLFVDNLNNK